MWNEPSEDVLEKIPRLFETEHIPIKDKLVYLHFYIADSHWWVVEYDGSDQFFCFCILNGDHFNSEWGYTSFKDLKNIKVNGWMEVENDCDFEIKKVSEISEIKIY